MMVYMRVSKYDYDTSLETQQELIEKKLIHSGVEYEMNSERIKFTSNMLERHPEIHSGYKKQERAKFKEMIEKLDKDSKKPPQPREYLGIAFFKIDSLARNEHDFVKLTNLLNAGYSFISVTENIENTPTGKMLFRILASFAVYESERLGNRMSYSYIFNLINKNYHKIG